ncbi:MAG: ribosome biogenesis GTPase Der [Spirochaetales bacterium]|nr:ribosome biogenesis GTPase Der [Candidatus Physcosoma equi]
MEKLDIRNKADIDTNLPLISIVGRPNVGKSTLFNRLIGKRRAITDPTPGVTRDPIPERWLLGNNPVTLVDTGGVKIQKEGIDYAVSEKSLSILGMSDIILFLMDCMEVTAEDQMLIEEMRPYTDKVVLVVNKVDDIDRDDLVWNYFSYGYQRVVGISAAHGLGIEELEDTLLGMLNVERTEEIPDEPESIKLAIMGKPNTGKSTLTNLLTGRDISIVSDIAGTTRDVMKGTFVYKGTDYTVLDTAGIRRKTKVEEDVEYYSVNRAIKTIDEADVVLLMIDVTEGLAEQDKKIAQLIVRRGKGIILCLNKIDKLSGVANELEAIKDRVRFLFPILNFAPLMPISALEGMEVGKLLDMVWAVWRQLNKRIDTSDVNEYLKKWTADQEPPRSATGYFKVLYGTQVSENPVRFLFFVNKVHAFPETYISYLKNCIRRDLGFSYVPVEISLRERKRNPSLNEKGPSKDEVAIQKVIRRNTSASSSVKKGVAKKPGGKARMGKEMEKAKKVVRNTKQKKAHDR